MIDGRGNRRPATLLQHFHALKSDFKPESESRLYKREILSCNCICWMEGNFEKTDKCWLVSCAKIILREGMRWDAGMRCLIFEFMFQKFLGLSSLPPYPLLSQKKNYFEMLWKRVASMLLAVQQHWIKVEWVSIL